jgi:hypothetical protein
VQLLEHVEQREPDELGAQLDPVDLVGVGVRVRARARVRVRVRVSLGSGLPGCRGSR